MEPTGLSRAPPPLSAPHGHPAAWSATHAPKGRTCSTAPSSSVTSPAAGPCHRTLAVPLVPASGVGARPSLPTIRLRSHATSPETPPLRAARSGREPVPWEGAQLPVAPSPSALGPVPVWQVLAAHDPLLPGPRGCRGKARHRGGSQAAVSAPRGARPACPRREPQASHLTGRTQPCFTVQPLHLFCLRQKWDSGFQSAENKHYAFYSLNKKTFNLS